MRNHRLFALCLAAALTAGVPGISAARQANPQQWRGTVLQGSAIEIKGVNGGIKAVPATGGEVEVSAVMTARKSNPADVRIDVVQHGDGVTICAVYPSPDSRPNECQPGEGGRNNTRDNDVVVAFTVRVPPGVRFVGHTVNGDVTTERLGAPVSAKTVNGDISFATSSYGEASTVNGSIRGEMGSTQSNSNLTFHTVNGSVTLTLPGDASAELRVRTVNGSINTDFPITVTGRVNPRSLDGTIGAGGRRLDVETVNGSVTLKRF